MMPTPPLVDGRAMRPIDRLMQLEVPVIVRLAEKTMTVQGVTSLLPGMIIELPKAADEMLDLLINNKPVGVGSAVKVGENFGLRIKAIGDEAVRLAALTDPDDGAANSDPASTSDAEMDALAAALLAGK